jgi:hypothetical protein
MSWNEQWTGTQQVRRIRLDGERLTYITEPARNPLDGRECVHMVIFERVPKVTPNHPISATSF